MLIVASGMFIISCGDDTSGGSARLVEVMISPISTTVSPEYTKQFSAAGRYSDNSVMAITPSWEASAGIGTIDATGLFVAGSLELEGSVTATYQGKSYSAYVKVSSSGGVTGTLESIVITTEAFLNHIGKPGVFSAVGKDINLQTVTISRPVWQVTGGIGSIEVSGATGLTCTFYPSREGFGTIKCSSIEATTSRLVTSTVTISVEGYFVEYTCDNSTYVSSSQPDQNFVASNDLIAGTTAIGNYITFIHFTIDPIEGHTPASFESINLILYPTDIGLLVPYTISSPNDAWLEDDLTYNTIPELLAPFLEFTPLSTQINQEISLDLNTPEVHLWFDDWSNNGIAINRSSNDTTLTFASGRNLSHPPKLQVVYRK
jgi:hypothetical protein